MIVEVIAQMRLDAALELVKAVDSMVLLEQCERATGQPWVTDADRARISRCRAEFLAVRPALTEIT